MDGGAMRALLDRHGLDDSALAAGQPDVLWLIALRLVWTQDRGIGRQQQTLEGNALH
jgi:hypothetical protein